MLALRKVSLVFFELCRELKGNGVDFSLVVAGPTESIEVDDYMRQMLHDFSLYVKYVGFVSGSEKTNFFECIDLLLFPSLYRNEAQPNVLFEAAAFGVPALAIDIGCIGGDLDTGSGYIFKDAAHFARGAHKIVAELAANPFNLARLQESTLRNIQEKSKASRQAYLSLLREVARV